MLLSTYVLPSFTNKQIVAKVNILPTPPVYQNLTLASTYVCTMQCAPPRMLHMYPTSAQHQQQLINYGAPWVWIDAYFNTLYLVYLV